MARHGLVDRPARTPADAAALICGLQAQDAAAARLAVRARSANLTDADVRTATDTDRTVVRTWLMRNTIHLVPAGDLRWLAALIGPMIHRRFASKRWPDLGLVPPVRDRIAAAAEEILRDGPLNRHEFVAALVERGIKLAAAGQEPAHIMVFLSTIGLVCHADGDRFALVSQWVPKAPAGPRGDDALAEFARRYFRAYSPATGADFTAWSGLPSRHAISLIRDELTPVGAGFALGEVAEPGGLRLLGGFDNYLLGHRYRDHIVDAEARGEIYIGGTIRPVVVHDGRVIGRWRFARPSRRADPALIEVRLFRRSSSAVGAAVDAEVADLGRFLGVSAERGQLRE
jgi:hypothetical protein